MNCIETSICNAVSVEVKPVHFRASRPKGLPAYVFATQRIAVSADDGSKFQLTLHFEEGCPALAMGDPVVFPTVDQVEGAAQ
ncbi:hypothetical protein D3C81_2224760 [compost metagenome]